jgi:hypothetical protein
MTVRRSRRFALSALACSGIPRWVVAAPALPSVPSDAAAVEQALDPALEARLLALDAQAVSEHDVREVLAHVPAPRIMALHGSVPILTMAPFAEFLIAMGYPAERLRNPSDGRLSYSSFGDSRQLAGAIAWHYEREGLMPLVIGHSQGGMLGLKVLQDLAGASGQALPVWDPTRGIAESRSTIRDPRTGLERPVVGLQLPFVAALATGSVMRVLLGQWDMVARLRSVPDSVDEFAGYFIAWDPIAGTGPDAARDNPYRPTGSARVRNVMLPSDYGHVTLPLAMHLATNPVTRGWISQFDPRSQPPVPPAIADADLRNIVHAADIWFSVKKSWCLQAQQWVRARRPLHQAS